MNLPSRPASGHIDRQRPETETCAPTRWKDCWTCLRQPMGLTGTKEGCGEGECGSCSVLDGWCAGQQLPGADPAGAGERKSLTIEGLARGPQLHALQEAFLQCGGRRSVGSARRGMILAACHLLNRNPQPTLEDIREGLSGNLCRCTGYTQILEAVGEAAGSRIREMRIGPGGLRTGLHLEVWRAVVVAAGGGTGCLAADCRRKPM